MKYSRKKIDAVILKLRTLPEVEKNHTKKETVRLLSQEIESLKKRGYTIEKIAEALRGEGLDFTTPALKHYLQRKKVEKKESAGVSPKKQETPPQEEIKRCGRPSKYESNFDIKPDTIDI